MQLTRTLRRVAAGAAGLAVVGMTISGALAADYTLANYPTPFTGSDTILVVGSGAATEDVTARENIGTSLTTSTTTTVGGGELELEDGELEDPQLGVALSDTTAFGSTGLDDTDNVGLLEGEVNINIGSDADYDFHEAIVFTSAAKTSTALNQTEEEFKDQFLLVLPSGSMLYNVTFEDSLAFGNYFNDSTSSNEIDMKFLGKDLTVRGATASTLTAIIGDKVTLNAGDVVKVGDHTVKFIKASTTEALLEVDGESYSKTTGQVLDKKGIEVYVDSVFDEEDPSLESAVLIVGSEAIKTYTSGNAYWDEDESNYLWEWNLANLNTAVPTVGIQLAADLDTVDTVHADVAALGLLKSDKSYLAVGDYLCLPHKYACLSFEGMQIDTADSKDVIFDASNVQKDLYPAGTSNTVAVDDAKVLLVTSYIGEDKGINVGAYKTDKVAITFNGTNVDGLTKNGSYDVYYWDKDTGKFRYAAVQLALGVAAEVSSNIFTFDYGDYAAPVYLTARNVTTADTFNITLDQYNDLNISFRGQLDGANVITGDITFLGAAQGEDTGSYFYYGSTAIDDYDYDVYTLDGVKVYAPQNNIDSDKVKISVPKDNEFKVLLRMAQPVGGAESAVTGVEKSAYTAMLDTEVTDVTAYNVIAVGGPAINKISAQLLGLEFPAVAAASGIPEGKAVIELMPNGGKWALVVAGWEAEQTLAAAKYLASYEENALSGMSVTLAGTVAGGYQAE